MCALKPAGIVDVCHAWHSVVVLVWVGSIVSCAKPFTALACVPSINKLEVDMSSDVLGKVCSCILQTGTVTLHLMHDDASVVACVPYCNTHRRSGTPCIMPDTSILISACPKPGLILLTCVRVACFERTTTNAVDDCAGSSHRAPEKGSLGEKSCFECAKG